MSASSFPIIKMQSSTMVVTVRRCDCRSIFGFSCRVLLVPDIDCKVSGYAHRCGESLYTASRELAVGQSGKGLIIVKNEKTIAQISKRILYRSLLTFSADYNCKRSLTGYFQPNA